jgi:hypothetical protein
MAEQLIRLEKREGHTRLVLDIPPDREDEISEAIKTLLEASDDPAVQDRLLQALITSAEQSYFWTPEWQSGEKQADRELAAGEHKTFDSMDEMMSFLDEQK